MSDNKELEIKANIPETVQLLKCFWSGTAKKGNGTRHGWEVMHASEVKTVWVDGKVNAELQPYAGKWVVLLKEQKKGSGGNYYIWHINEAMFDNNGKEPVNRKPPEEVLKDEAYRAFRKNEMYLALEDAALVAQKFNEKHGGAFLLTAEDVRAMAISFSISFQRKNGN